MKNNFYFQLDITTEPPLNDEEVAVLWIFQPDGLNLDGNLIRMFFDDLQPEQIELITQEMNCLVESGIVEKFDISSQKLEKINWNEEWQKNLKVLKAGSNFVVKPTFVEYSAEPSEIVIEIDPKMSFGTGEHETTRLILGLLEKYGNNRKFVLDAGAGTAILAIAAVKLGSKKAIAFDNDDWCLENGLENVRLNGVADKVEIRICETKDIFERNFDLIVANIQRDVLSGIAAELAKRQAPGGVLILSGLLIADEEIIAPIYQKLGYSLIDKAGENEWISLVFKLDA
ncbi:MAG: 50S ribosomal protein L11 methyltransferase [Ignavibacteriales bacterium]|nr:MAG: 50S ribosomal protein L11 methyltransferase [Ignavibacteriaceae bacterium]MBW7871887.1 50S ribosomal protein L11 methyltransferase [Ignavibacteria bacterium]MCZ2144263.1 50S ribosomal protein L11 methyltransferase [Ignavibacteriales bacterium]OQY69627.1 MAG: ribosomal protein L11 methyltransferase [Ignavibacteriales bacterium UTCHB3]MBV6446216.1 Ribosomal protein L11 methyltransferase [Ignavibacteriaceae bacterium]